MTQLVALWRHHAVALLSVQGFALAAELTAVLLPEETASAGWFLILPIIVVSWTLSVMGTATTYTFVRAVVAGQPTSVIDAYRTVITHFKPLLVVTLITGVAVSVGLLLLILPGVYFLVIYLFAPCVAMDQPGASPFAVLATSKHLTRRILLDLTVLAVASLGVGLYTSLIKPVGLSIALGVFTAAILNPIIAVLYLKARKPMQLATVHG